MNGTKVILRLKARDGKAKKILYFNGVPRPYQLYLALKDDFEFCPENMDKDQDIILENYSNVTVEMLPINVLTTQLSKVDHAVNVVGKPPDLVEVQEEGLKVNKYTWHNVKRWHLDQLINDLGGFERDGKYILFEEVRVTILV